MQEQEMPHEMLVARIAKQIAEQFRANFARILSHPRSRMFDDEVVVLQGRLTTLERYIPHRREALQEALASLLDEEDTLIEDIRKRIGALEFKLEKPEGWGTRRE